MTNPDGLFVSTILQPGHDVSHFTCGKQALDQWLRGEALRAQKQGTARTYVWLKADVADIVVAYYSLCPTSVLAGGISRNTSGGHSVLPAYLLARLALDANLQGQGFGSQLLADALERLDAATTSYGGRIIIVDAIDESVVPFYEKWGFRRIGETSRLYLAAKSLHALIAEKQA